MGVINIKGLNKAEILKRLYDASVSGGMGWIHYIPGDMTYQQAEALLEKQTKFDYMQGRPIKIDFKLDEFDTDLYDERVGGVHKAWEALRCSMNLRDDRYTP